MAGRPGLCDRGGTGTSLPATGRNEVPAGVLVGLALLSLLGGLGVRWTMRRHLSAS